MMQDGEILKNMIRADARVDLEKEYNNFYVSLCEPQEKGSKVIIRSMPDDAIVIKADKFESPDGIFQGNQGECKRGDYVIISSEKKSIIYIEMKKSGCSFSHIVKQLTGSKCFVKYCQEIGKSFWKKNDFLDNYSHFYVSITHTTISKRGTQISQKNYPNNSPEEALKISEPHKLKFGYLLSKKP